MNLNNIIINTRMRNGWSAIELGFCLARKFWLRSFFLYLTFLIPTYLLLTLIGIPGYIVLIVLWWLKPVFERPLLYCYSRELFSQPMSYADTLLHIQQWISPRIIWTLTLGRISAARCIMAPVALLEIQSFQQFRQRLNIIKRNHYVNAMWLTIVFIHLETIFTYSFYVIISDLMNLEIQQIFPGIILSTLTIDILTMIFMACFAPFYTAAGFILYISRRIELEGWDIEINFRRLVMQLTDSSGIDNNTQKKSINLDL